MKLPPKPAGKDRKPSPVATSMPPTATDASPTLLYRMDTAPSSPETPPPQAEGTPNQPSGSVKTLLLASPTLNTEEKQELYHLGQFLAKMPWLELHSEEPSFRRGAEANGGHVQEVPNMVPGTFDAIIVYRLYPNLKSKPGVAVANLQSVSQLKRFVSEAVKDLYRRGIVV